MNQVSPLTVGVESTTITPPVLPDMSGSLTVPCEDLGFVPHSPVPEVYENENFGITMERMLIAFQELFGIPRGSVSTKFRKLLKDTMEEHMPNLRCSSARAILEDRLNIPCPITKIHYVYRRRLSRGLLLLDLFETICQDILEKVQDSKVQDSKTEPYGPKSSDPKPPKKRRGRPPGSKNKTKGRKSKKKK